MSWLWSNDIITDAVIPQSSRLLEDEYSSGNTRDDDSYNALYHSCSREIHEELNNFGYIAGSILWYGLLVMIVHRCCLKVQLDGAPIYDTQYWFLTATIQFILILISILLFFPYPCSVEVAKHSKTVELDCIRHCQQDRYICMAISGVEAIIGCYWYYLAYTRYQTAQRVSRPMMNTNGSSSGNKNGMSARQQMDNGIFSKIPETDDDDIDDDDDNYHVEDGLEMTENSEDTWE
jgi:hypothetical protein